MTLFINAAEYIYSVTPSTGVRMLVHNQNQHPFMYDEGFDLKTGQRTVINIYRVCLLSLLMVQCDVMTSAVTSTAFVNIDANDVLNYSALTAQRFGNHDITRHKCTCSE